MKPSGVRLHDCACSTTWLDEHTVSITPDTYSHAIPAMQEEAAVRIAALVFAAR
jgi:hypothetical protein